jgi:hypothetical protein
MDNLFLGLNQFVWWFGVVENRLDPLELGRCKVRCFGWHTADINQIPIDDLPWAHPVVPYGVKAVQPPAEGTMVFGFFADGKMGQYPIIMGTVPGVPEEIRDNNLGFTDPYTEEQKTAQSFPRKIKEATIKTDTRGVQVVDDVARRNPANLNEPTTSRLSRPVRGVAEDGSYDGIAPESIANTTIDIQRKTRITDIKTAAGSTWDEPYPSYNAQYPFNNVTESESGHAFEIDDTKDFERVQLSHRTGSTLEFLPEGHTKIKSQSGRYDVTMGDHRNYVNGTKYETVDADFFLRVNGKFRIECDQFELVCKGNPGTATITAEQGAVIKGGKSFSASALSSAVTGGTVSLNGAVSTSIFGGINASLSSGGQSSIGGTLVHLGGNIVEADAQVFKTHGIQDFNSCLPPLGQVLKVPEPDINLTTDVEIGPTPVINMTGG